MKEEGVIFSPAGTCDQKLKVQDISRETDKWACGWVGVVGGGAAGGDGGVELLITIVYKR